MRASPVRLVADLAPGERTFTAAMCAYLFLVVATFWILKPLKKALFIQFYDAGGLTLLGWDLDAAEGELVAKLLNVLVAIGAVAAFTWLARRLRRHALAIALAASFVAAFLLSAVVLADPGHLAVWSFYLLGDLFSTIMVAGFFAFLNDTVSPAASKRLYGPIVAGGVGGGVFGALVLGAWIERLTPPEWLGVCGVLGGAIALVALVAGRAAGALPAVSRSPASTPVPARLPAHRAALVARSRYLLAIVAIVMLYEIVSTVMDFQFTSTVAHHFEGPAIGTHLARVFAFTNVVSVLVQAFVTGAVMSRLGVGTASSSCRRRRSPRRPRSSRRRRSGSAACSTRPTTASAIRSTSRRKRRCTRPRRPTRSTRRRRSSTCSASASRRRSAWSRASA
jgi:AAA family ATP:ADP antiporter